MRAAIAVAHPRILERKRQIRRGRTRLCRGPSRGSGSSASPGAFVRRGRAGGQRAPPGSGSRLAIGAVPFRNDCTDSWICCGVAVSNGGQQVDLEGNLAHRLALRTAPAARAGRAPGPCRAGRFPPPCRGSARTFRGFQRACAPYCALTSSRKRWSRASRVERGVFVTVGDEFERFLAAQPLIAGLQVDFEVLFAAGFVYVVVAAVHGHVDAAHFVDRPLELGEGDDEHVVDARSRARA